jgi:hypothetical protein
MLVARWRTSPRPAPRKPQLGKVEGRNDLFGRVGHYIAPCALLLWRGSDLEALVQTLLFGVPKGTNGLWRLVILLFPTGDMGLLARFE